MSARAHRLRALALVAAGLVALLVPAAAPAATFSLDYNSGSYILRYTAAAGEANALVLSSDGLNYIASDSAATITAGTYCTAVSVHQATCPLRGPGTPSGSVPTFPTVSIEIDVGDGNDSVSTSADCEVSFGACVTTITGGPGNDALTGGPTSDVFRVGATADGADTFAGGPGFDTVDYSARDTDVVVTIDGGANDGASGEHDNVQTDVDGVTGGRGNDSLTGSATANSVDGGFGNDTLSGLGGNDVMHTGSGDGDIVNGGDGDDTLDSMYANNATLNGDAGNDDLSGGGTLNGGDGNDKLTGSGALNGQAGDDTLAPHGGGAFSGGAGNDTFSDRESGIPQTFSGGSGSDTMRYVRSSSVSVTLDGTANDGTPAGQLCAGCPSEGDDVASDIETLIGTNSGDELVGDGGDNILIGASGDDHLVGGAGNDVLDGDEPAISASAGKDVLDGGAGDDVLDGGPFADTLNGGDGVDTVDYSARTKPVTVTVGADADDGESGEGDSVGPTGDVETVKAGSGDDLLVGDRRANTLDGGLGDDVLDGGTGADTLRGGAGEDGADYSQRTTGVTVTLDGLASSGSADDGTQGHRDTIAPDVEDVYGGSGPDRMTGNDQDNLLNGGPGPDILVGGAGLDVADYSDRAADVTVRIDGTPTSGNTDDGSSTGRDSVATDVEAVYGGEGDDLLVGSAGDDYLDGGPGDDDLRGGAGADVLVGALGVDAADYSERSAAVQVTLDGRATSGNADDGPAGGRDSTDGVEGVIGGAGADTLTGNGADNLFIGGPGADTIGGGGGEDAVVYAGRTAAVQAIPDGSPTSGGPEDGPAGARDRIATDVEDLVGGNGDDTLTGNAAANYLEGGAGNDALRTRDGVQDEVACDTGTDTVVADPRDTVPADCEQVDRGRPVATTRAASAIGSDTGTLTGTIDPGGLAAKYHFEYGATTAYGSRSPAVDQALAAADGERLVSAQLSGLRPGTTYHYRLVATNSVATSTGADGTFTTLRDVTPPRISGLRLTPSRLHAPTGRRKRDGAVISYRNSEKSTTTFVVERARGNRWVRVAGRFVHADVAGVNRLRFTGRVGAHALAPGGYRLVATPRDKAGNRGNSTRVRFRVMH